MKIWRQYIEIHSLHTAGTSVQDGSWHAGHGLWPGGGPWGLKLCNGSESADRFKIFQNKQDTTDTTCVFFSGLSRKAGQIISEWRWHTLTTSRLRIDVLELWPDTHVDIWMGPKGSGCVCHWEKVAWSETWSIRQTMPFEPRAWRNAPWSYPEINLQKWIKRMVVLVMSDLLWWFLRIATSRWWLLICTLCEGGHLREWF